MESVYTVMAIGKVRRNQSGEEGTDPRGKLQPKLSMQGIKEVPQSRDLGGGECVPERTQLQNAGANWAPETIKSIPFHWVNKYTFSLYYRLNADL